MTAPMPRILHRLDLHDRRLRTRWARAADYSAAARLSWVAVTQLGSAVATILAALLIPLAFLPGEPRAWYPAAGLTVSHLLVQLLKRAVQRDRPDDLPVVRCPDRFSFPSGHATSSLAICLSLGLLVPVAAPALLTLALLIGASRVVLGVHYPGDVIAGQLIATITVAVIHGLS